MIISQRTETGIQTSETGHKMGEQWESHWRNTNWGKRFDYRGVGKQRIPVSNGVGPKMSERSKKET